MTDNYDEVHWRAIPLGYEADVAGHALDTKYECHTIKDDDGDVIVLTRAQMWELYVYLSVVFGGQETDPT